MLITSVSCFIDKNFRQSVSDTMYFRFNLEVLKALMPPNNKQPGLHQEDERMIKLVSNS